MLMKNTQAIDKETSFMMLGGGEKDRDEIDFGDAFNGIESEDTKKKFIEELEKSNKLLMWCINNKA